MAVKRTLDGPQVAMPQKSPRAKSLDAVQIRRSRNEDWYREFFIGQIGPDGKRHRRSIRTIAAIYNLSPRAVRNGIKEAARLRKKIADVADACRLDIQFN